MPASLTGKTVTAIAAGGHHNVALTSDGIVTAWGGNINGESTVPVSLTGNTATPSPSAELLPRGRRTRQRQQLVRQVEP